MTSFEALRVAIMPASGPFFGTSVSQPSGSRRSTMRCSSSRWSDASKRSRHSSYSSRPRSTLSRKCPSASSGMKNGSSLGQL